MLVTVAKFLAQQAIAMLMLSVALRTETALIHDLAARRRVLVRALLVVWVAVPLFALAVLLALRPSPLDAGLLMVLAICPGVPMVVHRTRTTGDPKTTLLVLIATALTAFVLVPLWAAVLTRTTALELRFGILDVAKVLAPTVLVPFMLGRLVVYIVPRFAKPLAALANLLFAFGIAIIVLVALAKLPAALRELGVRDVIAALVIPAGAGAIGWLVTRGSRPERISVAYAAALGNPALALAVVARSYEIKALPWVLALVVLRALALVPFQLSFRRTAHDKS